MVNKSNISVIIFVPKLEKKRCFLYIQKLIIKVYNLIIHVLAKQ